MSLIVGGAVLSVQLVRSGWKPPAFGFTLIASLICAYATVVAAGFPVIDQTRPTPEIARWLTHSEPGSKEPLALYRLERWKASLRFYSGRPVVTIETVDDMRRFLDLHPAASVVLTEREAYRLAGEGIPLVANYKRSAVLGTEGRGLRRQRWGAVLVAVRGH
jgi:hypothetical protein